MVVDNLCNVRLYLQNSVGVKTDLLDISSIIQHLDDYSLVSGRRSRRKLSERIGNKGRSV